MKNHGRDSTHRYRQAYFPCRRKHLFTRSKQLRKLETALAVTIYEVGNHNYV